MQHLEIDITRRNRRKNERRNKLLMPEERNTDARVRGEAERFREEMNKLTLEM